MERLGHRSSPITISGRLRDDRRELPRHGQRDELLLATPGAGADTLWTFTAPGSHTAATVDHAGRRTAAPPARHERRRAGLEFLERAMGLDPVADFVGPPFGNSVVASTARPVVGSFVGVADRSVGLLVHARVDPRSHVRGSAEEPPEGRARGSAPPLRGPLSRRQKAPGLQASWPEPLTISST